MEGEGAASTPGSTANVPPAPEDSNGGGTGRDAASSVLEGGDGPAGTSAMENSGRGEVPRDLERITAVVGVVNDTPPFGSVNLFTGEAVGFDYDLATEIARRLNIHLEWRFFSRNALVEAVAERRLDFGMGAIARTAEAVAAGSEMGLVGSQPYLIRRQHVLLCADGLQYESVAALASDSDALIGVVGGSPAFYVAAYDVLQGDDETRRITIYSSASAVIEGLCAGEVDAAVIDGAAVTSLIAGMDGSIVVMDELLDSEAYIYIFPIGSDLVGPFNATIESMKSDGFIDERESFWFYEQERAVNQ